MQWDLRGGVQGDRRPYAVGGLTGDAVRVQKLPRLVGTVDLETLVGATEFLGQPEVVEHRPDVQQFGIELDALFEPRSDPHTNTRRE